MYLIQVAQTSTNQTYFNCISANACLQGINLVITDSGDRTVEINKLRQEKEPISKMFNSLPNDKIVDTEGQIESFADDKIMLLNQ